MVITRNLSSLALILFVLQLAMIGVVSVKSLDGAVSPSWFNFKKSKEHFTISNPLNKIEIQFPIEQKSVKATSIAITKQGYWKSIFNAESHQIRIIGRGENALIEISSKNNQVQVYFNNLTEDEDQNIFFSTQNLLASSFVSAKEICTEEKNQIRCRLQNQQKIYVFYHTSKTLQALYEFKQQREDDESTHIKQFVERMNINSDESILTQKIARSMLTHTLSSLCVQQSEYEGFYFYGLCSNSNTKQIDRHYSLLVIDILFKYNSDLAVWLVENFIDLLQQKLFYSFSGREWIPVPEHIEVFVTYINHLKENTSLSTQQLKKRINKVIEIQNGLINSLLLSQVNHLSEEINYRQNNKVHPTILKMLNQAWKTDIPRARVSSIYAESFTNDFFYHEQNQKLQTSVGKMIWLIKLINQHIKVIKNYGDSYQKESLEQLVSLAKVMNGFVLDDPKARNGDFYSIVLTQSLRVYTRSVGYESLLPFAYDISPAFPTNSMVNLTTSIGLASLPVTHHKVRETYNFRGNVNLYFNYKILFNMIERTKENPKFKIYYNGLKTVIDSLQLKVLATFAQGQNKQSTDFYTSWNPQGKGVTAENYLAILNVAFLKNIGTKSQKNPQNDQQIKRSQEKTQNVK